MRSFVLAVCCLSLLSCTKKNEEQEAKTIRIGHFASLTGAEATFGKSTDDGIRLAVDEVNEKGGINGKQVELITMDNQGKADEAAAVVTRLIEQEKVVAILGEVASSRSIAAAPIAQRAQIPMVSPSSTNPKVTEVGDFIFRTCFIDPFQGTVMAKFAFETLKFKKIAVLRAVNQDYSIGLADFFTKKFIELGGTIVTDLAYQTTDVDFKAQLTKIKGLTPDALFVPGYYTDVGQIAKQARELGIKVPFLGGDGWDSPLLTEIAGTALDGSYFSNHYSNESTDPVAQDFMKRFQAKFGKAPDGLAAAGYDAAQILFQAIRSSADLKPSNIRDELSKIKDYKGVTGQMTINDQRNAVKPAVVVQVQGKTNKFISSVNP